MEQIIHRRIDDSERHYLNEKDATLVVELPPGEFLKNLITELTEKEMPKDKKIHIKMGVAICSNKDQYDRKKGVEIAKKRMKALEFTIQEFRITPGMTYMHLRTDDHTFLMLRFVGGHVRVNGYSTPEIRND